MRQFFAARGLDYNPHPEIVPNSMRAQQLTELARDLGRHEAVHDRIMDAYWSEAQNIGDPDVLRRLADELELPADDVEEVLTTDRYRDRIVDATRQAVSVGANAVPAFVLDRRLLVLGAQPNETFEHAFAQLQRTVVSIRFVDELEDGFGWIESATMRRTSHALAVDGRVWLIDPIDADGLEERIRSLGEPAGVIQLLDRHNRDCAALAARLGVPLHVVPTALPGTPFGSCRCVRGRWWQRGRALVAGAADPRLRRRARHDPVLPRGRRAGRPAPVPPARAPRRALAGLGLEHLSSGTATGIHGEARRGSPSRRRCARGRQARIPPLD